MQDFLRVSLIQTHLHWENPMANRAHFSEKIEKLKGKTDLIILPEMFTTGFTMNAAELAENEDGLTLHWMIAQAKDLDAAITGSVIISEKNAYYNRLFFVFPDGTYNTYDKKHTFTLAGEHKAYQRGEKKLIVAYKGWKICPLICYDLRFPVWSRNTEDYDVLIYTANWPKKRISAWDALLKARSIENMSYCIGVNRIGLDGNGHEYTGHSAVYDVLGEQVSTRNFEEDFEDTVVLEKQHVQRLREQLQFLHDKDEFNLM